MRMRTLFLGILCAGSLLGVDTPQTDADKPDAWPIDDQVSYLLGRSMTETTRGASFNVARFERGLSEARNGVPSPFPGWMEHEIFMKQSQLILARQQADAPLKQQRNAAWLAQKLHEPGARALQRGVVLRHLSGGGQPADLHGKQVALVYRATLNDGTCFDASDRRGKGPVTFAYDQLLEGLRIGLEQMAVGETCTIAMPPEVGFGSEMNGTVPGDEALAYTVELQIAHKAEADTATELIAPPMTAIMEQQLAKALSEACTPMPNGLDAMRHADQQNQGRNAAWLAQKRAVPGARVLDQGVIIRRLAGEGKPTEPLIGKLVSFSYRALRPDGTCFDASDRQSSEPLLFEYDALPMGLQIGLAAMKIGETCEIVTPWAESGPESGVGIPIYEATLGAVMTPPSDPSHVGVPLTK